MLLIINNSIQLIYLLAGQFLRWYAQITQEPNKWT
jgi:hypothetical protein